ncbi:hypothetical protein LZ480_10615 [Solibacillus sp. MA9]|uniref:Aryl-alcohol dehydrogenase n=1 Tax=Solibacillus palustris TaxID=2908203 RepID=A0ABS9UEE4_9BACL|nr:hypothetical protein [Solibacillus sp. MA9]MCH7322343.1 hypothetical protein [Solibacillus sp. MA9]
MLIQLEMVHSAELIMTGKNMIGVVMGAGIPQLSIAQLVKFHEEGRFPFEKLVKFYDFDQINEAAKESVFGAVIKPIFIMDKTYRQ